MQSETDNIYASPHSQVKDFAFDAKVVEVFPDMIQRSVPGYQTMISTIGELAGRHAQDNTYVYDLGCSLGAASLAMRRRVQARDCKILAIDNSPAMVERCRLHLEGFKAQTQAEVHLADITELELKPASVIVMNFTMQFLDPTERRALVGKIHRALVPGGIFILSEKFRDDNEACNELLIDLHHDFKRANGYSELEISQKRNALENVMRIDTKEAHIERLKEAGFSQIAQWYQCFNFGSLFAIKD